MGKWDYIKLKSFWTTKKWSVNWSGHPQNGRKSLPAMHQTRDWLPEYTGNSKICTPKKINDPMMTWANDLNRVFSKEEVQMPKKHIKKWSPSLDIKEMQIKTTLTFHLTPFRITTTKNTINNKCWQEFGSKGTLISWWWECKLVQLLWKTVLGHLSCFQSLHIVNNATMKMGVQVSLFSSDLHFFK
jgi:hypothetical protein